MLSTILFIVSDLFLLLNVISIVNSNAKSLFQEKKLLWLFLIVHISFAAYFTTCFPLIGKIATTILLIVYFIRFIIIPFLLSRKLSFNLLYLPVLLISINSLFQRCGYWIAIQFNSDINESLLTKAVSLILQIAIFVFIYIINSHESRFTNTFKFSIKLVSKPIALLILLSIFITEGMISLVTYDTDKFAQQKNTIACFLIILVLLLFIIMISLLINSISKKYFEDTSKLMVKQVENQLEHYEALNEMRKEYHSFRHDYMNHMQCIRALIKSNKNSEAEEYINNLSQSSVISSPDCETGNYILDAIIADKTLMAEKSGMKIKVNGVFTDKFNSVDLCIIFSNLLDNAIEACLNVPGSRIIAIDMKLQQGYQFIAISNPYIQNNNTQLLTTKQDKVRHGFGLSNVRNAVERHGGELLITHGELFTVEMTLKV